MIDSLFPKARQRLLSILLLHPKKEFYLRELIRMSRMGQGSVQRELSSLVRAGLVCRRVEGNRVYYRADEKSPIYKELKTIIIKTAGVVDVMRRSLEKTVPPIDIAFIYGSFARGDEKAASDIDLMVIGNISLTKLVPLLKEAQERLGREINPTVYSRVEYRKRLKDKQHFCISVTKGKKIFVIGDVNELAKLA